MAVNPLRVVQQRKKKREGGVRGFGAIDPVNWGVSVKIPAINYWSINPSKYGLVAIVEARI